MQHESEAGVMYGTQRIEEAVTPFLYSGVETPGADGCDDNGDAAARKEGAAAPRRTIGEHVPGMGRREVDVSELRERLGVCLDAMRDPPPPWLKMKSRSEDPGAYFYFNPATNVASWDFPEEEEEEEEEEEKRVDGSHVHVDRGGNEKEEEDEGEEDEPIVASRLTRAQDCAAQFASRHR